MEERVQTKIYVCSPYRPLSKSEDSRKHELDTNIRRARQACHLLTKLGYFPLAPHLYFTQFLDDEKPSERCDGMNMAMEWLADADELWIFGDVVSEGMAAEIAFAKKHEKTVRVMPEPGRMVSILLEQMEQAKKNESEDEQNDEYQGNEE